MDEDGAMAVCEFTRLEEVSSSLEAAGVEVGSSSIRWVPTVDSAIADPDVAVKVVKLIDKLENLDDVQAVFTNFAPDDACTEVLAAAV